MVPSLLPGDEIIASSIPYVLSDPRPDDVVVMKEPISKMHVIKRVVKVSALGIYVRGDNAVDSRDSREYGFVAKKDLLGKMLCKL